MEQIKYEDGLKLKINEKKGKYIIESFSFSFILFQSIDRFNKKNNTIIKKKKKKNCIGYHNQELVNNMII